MTSSSSDLSELDSALRDRACSSIDSGSERPLCSPTLQHRDDAHVRSAEPRDTCTSLPEDIWDDDSAVLVDSSSQEGLERHLLSKRQIASSNLRPSGQSSKSRRDKRHKRQVRRSTCANENTQGDGYCASNESGDDADDGSNSHLCLLPVVAKATPYKELEFGPDVRLKQEEILRRQEAGHFLLMY